jgi:hypothetical protein
MNIPGTELSRIPDISAFLGPQPASRIAPAKNNTSFLIIMIEKIFFGYLEHFIELQSYSFFYQTIRRPQFIVNVTGC